MIGAIIAIMVKNMSSEKPRTADGFRINLFIILLVSVLTVSTSSAETNSWIDSGVEYIDYEIANN